MRWKKELVTKAVSKINEDLELDIKEVLKWKFKSYRETDYNILTVLLVTL